MMVGDIIELMTNRDETETARAKILALFKNGSARVEFIDGPFDGGVIVVEGIGN